MKYIDYFCIWYTWWLCGTFRSIFSQYCICFTKFPSSIFDIPRVSHLPSHWYSWHDSFSNRPCAMNNVLSTIAKRKIYSYNTTRMEDSVSLKGIACGILRLDRRITLLYHQKGTCDWVTRLIVNFISRKVTLSNKIFIVNFGLISSSIDSKDSWIIALHWCMINKFKYCSLCVKTWEAWGENTIRCSVMKWETIKKNCKLIF